MQIIATELGVSKLSTSADVIVNLLDINDNRPDFSQSSYEINIPENQLAGVQIGQVSQSLGTVQTMQSREMYHCHSPKKMANTFGDKYAVQWYTFENLPEAAKSSNIFGQVHWYTGTQIQNQDVKQLFCLRTFKSEKISQYFDGKPGTLVHL